METHKIKSSRKTFYHYLFEFVMLFLAVTAGFFADNLREENVEHHRELKYMHTLVEDLKKDINEIDRIRPLRIAREDSIGTLISLLTKKEINIQMIFTGW